MFWYVLNIFLIFCAWAWLPGKLRSSGPLEGEEARRSRTKRTCIVGTVNWILLSGLRHWSIGADTGAYATKFSEMKSTTWAYQWGQVVLRITGGESEKDSGYDILEKCFQIFSDNYQLWLVFIALVFMIPLGIWIYRRSSNAFISFLVFSTLFYSFFAITGHRQTIATAIAFFGGLVCIEHKKPILFILTVLLASLIHASAIALLPLYWLRKIKINGLTLLLYWAAVVLAFVFREGLLGLLQSIVGYEDYGEMETAHFTNFMALLILMAVTYTIFYKRIQQSPNGSLQMASNALFVACFFSPLLLINESAMRAVQYYSIFIIILLPEFKYIFKPESRKFFNLAICAMMIFLLVKDPLTYHFFWEVLG